MSKNFNIAFSVLRTNDNFEYINNVLKSHGISSNYNKGYVLWCGNKFSNISLDDSHTSIDLSNAGFPLVSFDFFKQTFI